MTSPVRSVFSLAVVLAELNEVGAGAVVEPVVDHVALGAMDAGDDRPGRVIVRRHLLSRAAGRGIEREAVVGILAQAIDAAVGAERKLVRPGRGRAAGEAREQTADLVELVEVTPVFSSCLA